MLLKSQYTKSIWYISKCYCVQKNKMCQFCNTRCSCCGASLVCTNAGTACCGLLHFANGSKSKLNPYFCYGKNDWERAQGVINTSSSSPNEVEQERKHTAHNSAPMTPTSRASSSRKLLGAVSKYQLCHSGLCASKQLRGRATPGFVPAHGLSGCAYSQIPLQEHGDWMSLVKAGCSCDADDSTVVSAFASCSTSSVQGISHWRREAVFQLIFINFY